MSATSVPQRGIVGMKTLYVTDLDGTLLNRNSKISDRSIRIINGLMEQGMLFTYATARSLSSASVVTKGLSAKIPVIAYNGAFIFQPDTGAVIASEKFTRSEIGTAIQILRDCSVSPFVYSMINGRETVTWNVNRENDGKQRYLSQRKGDKRFRSVTDDVSLYEGDIFYFTCIGEREELKPVYEACMNSGVYTCTFQQELYRTEYWCEIMPRGATKANAIQKLKELWDCDRIISFGDAVNDIPMFQISDECYAVENAVEELKQLATGIIGGNDADGVTEWLKTHVIIKMI